ncbi:MAG: hypothetical protein Q9180_006988 [Flavoplaca navasiana]
MVTRTSTTLHTSTTTMKSSSSMSFTTQHSSGTIAQLAIRSVTTLYPPAPSHSISTLAKATAVSMSADPKQPQVNSDPSSPSIPATAFWAVLAALIFVLILIALAFPLWYWLRGRHSNKTKDKNMSSTSPPNTWPGSSQSVQWSSIPYSNHSQIQHLTPTQLQQLQILSQLQHPAPVAPSSDPNRRALLARLAALNNPSILGAIPEDSTVLTTSSVYPGNNERQVVNQHWANIKEKRLQEARDRGEVCEMEVAGEEGGREKKVRFREREWAVLASDGGGSRFEEITNDDGGQRRWKKF